MVYGCEICGDVEDKYVKWPGGIIPYYIDPAFKESDRQNIYESMQRWEKSGITFEEKSASGNYICHIILKAKTASAISGYHKDSHIYLQEDFGMSNAKHELGHVICLPDEVRRKDRNKYIEIHWDNIRDGEENHFGIDYKIPYWYYEFVYDINSIMHYSSGDYSKGRDYPTLNSIENPDTWIYNIFITDKDIEKVKMIYE